MKRQIYNPGQNENNVLRYLIYHDSLLSTSPSPISTLNSKLSNGRFLPSGEGAGELAPRKFPLILYSNTWNFHWFQEDLGFIIPFFIILFPFYYQYYIYANVSMDPDRNPVVSYLTCRVASDPDFIFTGRDVDNLPVVAPQNINNTHQDVSFFLFLIRMYSTISRFHESVHWQIKILFDV